MGSKPLEQFQAAQGIEAVVLASKPGKADDEVILAALLGNSYTPFVTWRRFEGERFSGNYHETIEAALEDYYAR